MMRRPCTVTASKASEGVRFEAKTRKFEARSPRQEECMSLLLAPSPSIAMLTGPAGCGKTRLAVEAGLNMLDRGRVDRLVITRPAVAAGEQHGFVPGTLDDKMRPWLLPVTEALMKSGASWAVEDWVKVGKIEFATIAHMRGRTFERSYVICDEAQNCTREQMLMLMTRVGKHSKLVVAGDPDQSDVGASIFQRVTDAVEREVDSAHIAAFRFDATDVQRHPVVRDVIRMFKSIS